MCHAHTVTTTSLSSSRHPLRHRMEARASIANGPMPTARDWMNSGLSSTIVDFLAATSTRAEIAAHHQRPPATRSRRAEDHRDEEEIVGGRQRAQIELRPSNESDHPARGDGANERRAKMESSRKFLQPAARAACTDTGEPRVPVTHVPPSEPGCALRGTRREEVQQPRGAAGEQVLGVEDCPPENHLAFTYHRSGKHRNTPATSPRTRPIPARTGGPVTRMSHAGHVRILQQCAARLDRSSEQRNSMRSRQ